MPTTESETLISNRLLVHNAPPPFDSAVVIPIIAPLLSNEQSTSGCTHPLSGTGKGSCGLFRAPAAHAIDSLTHGEDPLDVLFSHLVQRQRPPIIAPSWRRSPVL